MMQHKIQCIIIALTMQLLASAAFAAETDAQDACRQRAHAVFAAAKLRDEQKSMQTAIRHLKRAGYSSRLAFDSAAHVYRYTDIDAKDLFQQQLELCGLGAEKLPPPALVEIKSPECIAIETEKQALQRKVDGLAQQIELLEQRLKLAEQVMERARSQVDQTNSDSITTFNKAVTDYNDFVYQHYRVVNHFNELQLELERKTHQFYNRCGPPTKNDLRPATTK